VDREEEIKTSQMTFIKVEALVANDELAAQIGKQINAIFTSNMLPIEGKIKLSEITPELRGVLMSDTVGEAITVEEARYLARMMALRHTVDDMFDAIAAPTQPEAEHGPEQPE
jgi:hypothetical protein